MKKPILILLLLLGQTFLFANETKIDSLENKLEIVSGKEKVDVLNKLSELYIQKSTGKAFEYCEKASELAKSLNYKEGEALSFYYFGKIHGFLSEYKTALEYLQKALKSFEKLDDKKMTSQTLNDIGYSCYLLGDFNVALENINKALNISKGINDSSIISLSLYNLGLCNRKLGNLDIALDYYFKSLDYVGKTNHNTFNGISIIYGIMKNFDKSLEYQKKALKIRKELGNKDLIIGSLNNMGIIYQKINKPEKALEYLLESVKISEEIGKKTGIGRALINIGSLYEDNLNEPEKALEYYLKSLEICKETDETYLITNTLIIIGNVQTKLKKYKTALSNLEQGLESAKQIQAKELVKNAYFSLSYYYYNIGNYKNAFENHKSYVAVKDSIFNKESSNGITEMQVKYETGKTEKENEIYKLKIEKNKLQNTLLFLGLIIFLILMIVLYFRYKIKTKANKLLKNEIAERKKIENELESRVADKTGELRNEITERMQATEALEKSEEKYRLLADNSIDAIWQMDLKLFFTYVSPSVKNIMGYSVEEWNGSRLSQHVTRKEFFKMAREALLSIKNYKTYKHAVFDTILIKKDGTEIFVEINAKLLFNNKGLPIGIQGTTSDITERKKTGEELKKYREHLEELVKERTKELEEKNKELENFNSLFVDREFRIKELRDRVKELEKKNGAME